MKKIIKMINTGLLAVVFGALLFLYFIHGPMAVVEISVPSLAVAMLLFLLSCVEITLPAQRSYKVSNAPGTLLMRAFV